MHQPYAHVFPTVDGAVTIAGREILLIERAKPPFEQCLVLPGGHVDEGERCAQACARELLEEINLEVKETDLKLLTLLDETGRDPRSGHTLSIVFTIDLPDRNAIALCKPATDAKHLHVRQIDSLAPEEMGFDHWQVIERLRKKLS
ncbi:MAG: hydrolase with MutT domain-containing protein [Candidatus Uhrbacteria bacterium GW2011_GWE2_40_58]|nr:MAG: hydrolase with MutT domain-containing protein [Candidatus Uhrbacteria bacterium GW2011_GWF2_40_263]KKR67646.1 MAG: hydrolase with MutT domain-containing protein [Candidatus Uhrbacteria bacterium GW2011_GWE2_40_58]OGL94427.1 MAG: hypothetical protein A2239_01940 [Candidatus Uhrbacteria bacterium RIFOXYA2_FULL_40_9]OGL96673.1 MAG: hypothetical protein A2332_05110 [Candidatus Uhrbacteria bacterium RIFOXYB2_FULL_41_18]